MHICMRVVQWMDAQAACSKGRAHMCAYVCGVKHFPVRENYQICMRLHLRLRFACGCVGAYAKAVFHYVNMQLSVNPEAVNCWDICVCCLEMNKGSSFAFIESGFEEKHTCRCSVNVFIAYLNHHFMLVSFCEYFSALYWSLSRKDRRLSGLFLNN